jgi:hypothetical protein
MKTIVKHALLVFLAFIILFNSGCATIFGHSHYSVVIKSNPPAATITITNREGMEVFKGAAPAVVDLKSSMGYFSRAIYQVKFHLDGYQDKTISIESRLNGWYIGNIVLGGVLGMLIIDPLTGAMYKIDEKNIETDLQPTTHAQASALQIININDVPAGLKNHLVAINK